MSYTIEDFAMMEPMRYYDNPEPKTAGLQQKRIDMIENKGNEYIASVKNDGDWGMFIHYSKGHNLIRSRSISKVTGVYGDYTDKLPHLVEEMDYWPDNSVVLAEICWNEVGTNANTVGTILRCLPAKAVERQKEKKLSALVFDVLMWNGQDLTSTPYDERLYTMVYEFNCTPGYFQPTRIIESNFAEEADNIIAAGGEGLVIQRKDNPYMPGTRTAWKTLKLKQTLPHMELKVVGVLEPNKYYEGDCPDNWEYWYQDMCYKKNDGTYFTPNSQAGNFAVTKPYFYGWKNGVVVDFNGVKVSVASGLTDADREWLATDEAATLISNGELYAEVKAMSVNDLGSLRHPVLIRLRNDM